MARQPALDPETAYEMKSDMFNGMSYADIMQKFGISYQTCINIKGGKGYTHIPWPDGTTGPMASMQAKILTSARRAATSTNRTLSSQFGDDDPDPDQELLDQGVSRRTLDAVREALFKLRDAELERRHQEMLATIDERQAEFERRWAAGDPKLVAPAREDLPDDQVDPDANDKYEWEDVKMLANAKDDMVKNAEASNDVAWMLAICIIYKIIKPSRWMEKEIQLQVLEITSKIKRFWEAHPDRDPREKSRCN